MLVAGACARIPAPPVPTGPPLLTVVTWNMHAGAGDLPRLVADLSAGRLTGTAAPDYLLLLQEAMRGGSNDVEAFAAQRTLASHYVVVRQGAERTSGNAILSTRPLIAARTIDLPRERQPRSAAAADIEVNGTRLFVVAAHLENRLALLRGAVFGDSARGRQAMALIDALPPTGHGIVGGDMNTMLGPNEPAWRALLTRFGDTPPSRPDPTFRDRLVLDHLFFDLPDGWQATRQVVRERYGSDHHPVAGIVWGAR